MEPTSRGVPASSRDDLPVRGLHDVRLADLLGPPGCPICRVRSRAAADFLAALLWESVNDPGIRSTIDAVGGFCHVHLRDLVTADRAQSGGVLGAAILVTAMLAGRLEPLAGISSTSSRGARKRVELMRQPWACMVCRRQAVAESGAVTRTLELANDPHWAASLSRSELCFDDLLLLWHTALRSDTAVLRSWLPVGEAQVARLRGLEREVQGFVRHSSFDRRPLLTASESSATDRAVELLAGARLDPVRRR